MIHSHLKELIGFVNAGPALGYPPRGLVVVDHASGGGFAGAPQKLYVTPVRDRPEEAAVNVMFPEAAFPEPGPAVEYRLGGHGYMSHLSPFYYATLRKARMGEAGPPAAPVVRLASVKEGDVLGMEGEVGLVARKTHSQVVIEFVRTGDVKTVAYNLPAEDADVAKLGTGKMICRIDPTYDYHSVLAAVSNVLKAGG